MSVENRAKEYVGNNTLALKRRCSSFHSVCHDDSTAAAQPKPLRLLRSSTISFGKSYKSFATHLQHWRSPSRSSSKRKDDSLQFFKELRTDTALYNLYLKKVRYHTPSDQIDGGSSSQDCLLQWRMVEVSVLRAGTMSSIIASLCNDDGELDSTTVNVFLATFRPLASSRRVIDLLIDRYMAVGSDEVGGRKMKQSVKDAHQRSIRSFLCVWLDRHPEDFDQPPAYSCLTHLVKVTKQHMPGCDVVQRAATRLEHFHERDEQTQQAQHHISVDDIQLNMSPLTLGIDSGRGGGTATRVRTKRSPLLSHPVELEDVPVDIFAEQLTYMDAMLFRNVVPHHCLGGVWSRGDKKHTQAPSVYATINQFNAVSYRVIASILKHIHLSNADRARIIEKWISVAQELRILKNFSSLKAIISGLQSISIYRLKKVWALVDRDSMDDFEELAEIFSEENNQIMARELLMREGTAKFADLDSTNTMKASTMSKRQSIVASMLGTNTIKSKRSASANTLLSVQGTVPYLGTFLTDLTMIDTAMADFTEPGGANLNTTVGGGFSASTPSLSPSPSTTSSLTSDSQPQLPPTENCEQVGEEWINFEKKRKEFEILAQIKLLQSSASLYMINPDATFWEWFHAIRVYDDKESYDLSCEIEPVTPSTPNLVKGHRKKSSLGFFSPRRPSPSMDDLSQSSASIYSEDTMSSVSETPEAFVDKRSNMIRHSMSVGSLGTLDVDQGPKSSKSWSDDSAYVIKVSMEVSECHHTNNYKCIQVRNSDHTKAVIGRILEKFNMPTTTTTTATTTTTGGSGGSRSAGAVQDYVIFQLLPDGQELMIPDSGNVYYALNSNVEEKLLVVRKKSEVNKIKTKHKQKRTAKTKKKLTL